MQKRGMLMFNWFVSFSLTHSLTVLLMIASLMFMTYQLEDTLVSSTLICTQGMANMAMLLVLACKYDIYLVHVN